MPKSLHAVRVTSQVWNALRQLNPGNVATEARRRVRVAVIGPADLLRDAAAYLVGSDPSAYDRAADTLALLPTPLEAGAFAALARCDIVIRSEQYSDVLPGVVSERIFSFGSADDLPAVVRRILASGDLAYAQIPLARALPGIRAEAAAHIIQITSLENAAFVASTSLGNVIPNPLQPLASVAESLGDLIVITANQLRMLFRLAALFERDLGYGKQAPEVVSIIGAAFGWRSIARELVAKIPFGGGIGPKAAIAFAGTWAVGDGIAYYYTTGRRPTRQELRARFDAALATGRKAVEEMVARLKAIRG